MKALEDIYSTIDNNIEDHSIKCETLLTLKDGLRWFLSVSNFEFNHIDIRGGNVRPTIILSTKNSTDFFLNQKFQLQKSFEEDVCYLKFKKYLFAIGFLLHGNLTYFYLECNNDLLDPAYNDCKESSIIACIYNRINNPLFNHIEQYLIKDASNSTV